MMGIYVLYLHTPPMRENGLTLHSEFYWFRVSIGINLPEKNNRKLLRQKKLDPFEAVTGTFYNIFYFQQKCRTNLSILNDVNKSG